jgi:Ca2+-binding EF-hand superfamily protein
MSQLSPADRKKVMKELHDVGKELFAALNSQSTSSTSATSSASQINSLFSAMDTNGDGSVSKSELTNYLSQLSNSPQGAADLLIGSFYNPQGGLTTAASSAVGSSINVTA